MPSRSDVALQLALAEISKINTKSLVRPEGKRFDDIAREEAVIIGEITASLYNTIYKALDESVKP